ncbi:MAG: DUF6809 family protein [Acidaminococcaceae bacterium]
MKSILESLYNSLLSPPESAHPHNKRYCDVAQKLGEEEQYFMSKMSVDDKKRFHDYSSLHFELASLEEKHGFSYGFVLGIQLMSEVKEKSKSLFNK